MREEGKLATTYGAAATMMTRRWGFRRPVDDNQAVRRTVEVEGGGDDLVEGSSLSSRRLSSSQTTSTALHPLYDLVYPSDMLAGRRIRPSTLPSPAAWFPRQRSTYTLPIFTHPFSSSLNRETGKNKSQWIARQRNDPYVRARSAANSPSTSPSSLIAPSSAGAFVARSSFKLLELHEGWKGGPILRKGMTVVDLGAAPGGWIQAAQEVLQGEGYIVGLDLLPLQRDIGNTPGVSFIQGDFLDAVTWSKLRQALKTLTKKERPTVDLILSDMMGSMSGSATRDAQLSLDLSEAALEFAVQHLTPSPLPPLSASRASIPVPPVQLIIKHFTSQFTADFRKALQHRFRLVKWVKPGSSRGESREGFFVCAGFKPTESE